MAAGRAAGKPFGETWSGRVDAFPQKVWYNVTLAKTVMAAVPVPYELLQDISVAMMWECQVSKSEVHAEHLDHVDTTDPILLVTTHTDPRGDWVTLIDGNHRVARAYRDGVEFIKGITLSEDFSRRIMLDPREAVFDELITELLATGGKVDVTDAAVIIAGGNPAPSTPDDHPYREELIRVIRGGPALFPLRAKAGAK
jgi:hypothetical protein